jgi:hypothetical protein
LCRNLSGEIVFLSKTVNETVNVAQTNQRDSFSQMLQCCQVTNFARNRSLQIVFLNVTMSNGGFASVSAEKKKKQTSQFACVRSTHSLESAVKRPISLVIEPDKFKCDKLL